MARSRSGWSADGDPGGPVAQARRPRLEQEFGSQASAALDHLELTELAWHDCYAEPTFCDETLADLLKVADRSLARLVSAALLAVADRRDLRLAANDTTGREVLMTVRESLGERGSGSSFR